jgi:hypothetical protein
MALLALEHGAEREVVREQRPGRAAAHACFDHAEASHVDPVQAQHGQQARKGARRAGSLLKAANLPELITYSLEDYEALALELAHNPEKLGAIKKKLHDTRLEVPLFDTEKFTRNIEKAYQTMWETWLAGEKPRSFSV